MEGYKEAVANLAAESRRFARVYERALTKLDASEQKRYTNQLQWFTKKIEESFEEEAVVNLAIESWRFARMYERVLTKLDAGEQKQYISQLRWFTKKIEESLEEVGLRIVNVEGHPYDPGMAARPLNIEDFETDDPLVVDRMLEPIIMGREGLVKTGTVTLRRRII